MRRREFLGVLSGAAAVWPVVARGQQAKMPVIGFLNSGKPELSRERMRAFHQGLNEANYAEGKNVIIEYRWAAGQIDQLPTLASDLVRLNCSVIVATGGDPPVLAAKAATGTIPIVFVSGGGPIEAGFVRSMNHPGGNITGITMLAAEVAQKRLEILHELVPKEADIALLNNPTSPASKREQQDLLEAARILGRRLTIVYAANADEISAAFLKLVEHRVAGLIIGADNLFSNQSGYIAALALRHALPALGPFREYAVAGNLMSYGASIDDAYRLAGVYAGRILKGESPAVLPVQQPTKIELIINTKTARALGLTIPPTLLARADEVIE